MWVTVLPNPPQKVSPRLGLDVCFVAFSGTTSNIVPEIYMPGI